MIRYERLLNSQLVLYLSIPMTLLCAGRYEHDLSSLRHWKTTDHEIPISFSQQPTVSTACQLTHAAFFDFFFLSVDLDEEAGAATGAGSALDFLLFFSGDLGVSTLAGVAS